MTADIYRISKYCGQPPASYDRVLRRRYTGYVVDVGVDAAIEISRATVTGYIDGAPCHPEGQMQHEIARRRKEILSVVTPLLDDGTDRVVLAGKWEQFYSGYSPTFTPYLVHRVFKDGAIVSSRYKFNIFRDSDDWSSDIGGSGGRELREDAAYLQAYAELELGVGIRFTNGMPWFEGVLWFPDYDDRLPIIYSRVHGRDAPAYSVEAVSRSGRPGGFVQEGDGTFDGEFRARSKMLGDRRASLKVNPVDRKESGPSEATLQDILARHGEVGYWCQLYRGAVSASTDYMFPHDDEHNREVLKPVDPGDDLAFGNAYASEWTHPWPNSDYKRRFLAVGVQPGIDGRPL